MKIIENGVVTVKADDSILIENFRFNGECMGNMSDGALLAMQRAIEILEKEIKKHEKLG